MSYDGFVLAKGELFKLPYLLSLWPAWLRTSLENFRVSSDQEEQECLVRVRSLM